MSDGQDTAVLQDQFIKPSGLVGRVTGWIMARANAEMNRFGIGTLDVQPTDHVLEIGFGPGHAIELLVHRTAAAFIAGVDPSDEMVEAARIRNAEAVDAGRVELYSGVAERLPIADKSFDKVLAVSNFLIWDSPELGLAEVRRVLRPGGRIVICLRRASKNPRWWKSPGASPEDIATARQWVQQAGFRRVRIVERRLRRRTICLVAER